MKIGIKVMAGKIMCVFVCLFGEGVWSACDWPWVPWSWQGFDEEVMAAAAAAKSFSRVWLCVTP